MRPGNRRVRNHQFLYAALYVNYRSTSKRRCGFHNRGQYILCERIRVIVCALYTGEPGGATWKFIRTPRPVYGERSAGNQFLSRRVLPSPPNDPDFRSRPLCEADGTARPAARRGNRENRGPRPCVNVRSRNASDTTWRLVIKIRADREQPRIVPRRAGGDFHRVSFWIFRPFERRADKRADSRIRSERSAYRARFGFPKLIPYTCILCVHLISFIISKSMYNVYLWKLFL